MQPEIVILEKLQYLRPEDCILQGYVQSADTEDVC